MAGITGLSGLPRSGKSYTSIELFVLPALKEGRAIITNLPLRMDAIRRDFPGANVQIIDDLERQSWLESDVGNGCLLILDEVWRLWPQGKKMQNIPESQLAMLKEHGHRSDNTGRSMDIVLITQDMQDICAPVRALIETTVICVKHLDLGREDSFIRYRCRMACSIDKRDNQPPKSQFISAENSKYKNEVWQYYRTHMNSFDGATPDEHRMVNTSVFGSFKFKAGVVVLILSIVTVIWAGSSTYKAIVPTPVSVETTTVTTSSDGKVIDNLPVVEPAKPAASVDFNNIPYSTAWRIAGFIYNYGRAGQKPVYILISQTKAERRVYADKCKVIDLEAYCPVDGEIVTRFSGRSSAGYMPDVEPVESVKSNVSKAVASPAG